mmetsp:Transcript_12173/g.29162  ORF Transcript_12173/g.29162 Transcript_12173/m.29162 type:complete len:152 (+) Transcript_12173:240-695(+)
MDSLCLPQSCAKKAPSPSLQSSQPKTTHRHQSTSIKTGQRESKAKKPVRKEGRAVAYMRHTTPLVYPIHTPNLSHRPIKLSATDHLCAYLGTLSTAKRTQAATHDTQLLDHLLQFLNAILELLDFLVGALLVGHPQDALGHLGDSFHFAHF